MKIILKFLIINWMFILKINSFENASSFLDVFFLKKCTFPLLKSVLLY